MFEFELRPHPARQKLLGKDVPLFGEKELAVYVKDDTDGRFYLCGYVGNRSGAPVCLIKKWPDQFITEVEEFIASKLGSIPKVAQPSQIIAEPDDEEDDD